MLRFATNRRLPSNREQGPGEILLSEAVNRNRHLAVLGVRKLMIIETFELGPWVWGFVGVFPSVDAGHGWLIFALPTAEATFHPAEENDRHELYLMCDDLKAEMAALRSKGVECAEVTEARWGSISKIGLPGGGAVGLYQPKHPTPSKLR